MYNKLKKSGICLMLFLSMCIMTLFSCNAFADIVKDRIYGQDRIETSIEISKNGWKNGSDYVVIAQGYDFADALSAAPLAKKYNAPIILNSKEALPDNTVNELKRLKVKEAFILGGPKVISEKAENQLKALNINVERIYGPTRFETAIYVANKVGTNDGVFVTNGRAYPDALSVSSIAASKGYPIVYTEKDSINKDVKKYIEDNKISNVYFVGGNGVIDDKVLAQVKNSKRLSGIDRYETNNAVLDHFVNELNFENVYFVTGQNFADALSIAPLAADKNAPVILTNKNINKNLENVVNSQLTSESKLIAIGGEAVVPSNVLNNFKSEFKTIKITEDNKVYGEDKVKDLKANIIVEGNNATIKNLKLQGNLVLDPGEKGTVNVENVNCKNIIVKSGDINSIKLINVNAKRLLVNSKNNVAVKLFKNSKINNTEVKSDAILKNEEKGSFGAVKVTDSESKKVSNIELVGAFEKDLTVQSKANIKSNEKVNKIVVNPKNVEEKINITGATNEVHVINGNNVVLDGTMPNVKSENKSQVTIKSNSNVKLLKALHKSKITIENGAKVSKVEKHTTATVNGKVDKIVNKENKPTGGGSSSGSSGGAATGTTKPSESEKPKEPAKPAKPIEEGCFRLTVINGKKDNQIVFEKDIKVERKKNMMKFLREYLQVKDKQGLVTEINGIENVNIKDLTLEQRKRDILGEDWFIYLRKQPITDFSLLKATDKTPVGAEGIRPKEGEQYIWQFREWDWKDMLDPTQVGGPLPLKGEGIPDSIKVNEKFTVKATFWYRPMYYAVVKVDGKEVAKTDIEGNATISISTPGKHKVSMEKGGGSFEKTVNVIKAGGASGSGSSSGSSSSSSTPAKDKVIYPAKKVNGLTLEIKQLADKSIDVSISSEDKKENPTVTIKILDEQNKLAYIDQSFIKDGKCQLKTKLDKGKYHGSYNVNGKKVDFEFTVESGDVSTSDSAPAEDKIIYPAKTVGDSTLEVQQLANKSLNLNISNKDKKENYVVTVKILDEQNKLAYIDQSFIKDGKCQLKTKLDKGKYHGSYKLNGKKVDFQFTVE